jgi:hypothetical protein
VCKKHPVIGQKNWDPLDNVLKRGVSHSFDDYDIVTPAGNAYSWVLLVDIGYATKDIDHLFREK